MDKIAVTFFIDAKEQLIERIAGVEFLNEMKPISKLKVLQTMRSKIEREILSTLLRSKIGETNER